MRHNKKRNTALLYEFLIRHVSRCLIEGNKSEANRAVAIIKKYFTVGPLYEELILLNYFLDNKVKTQEFATRLIYEVYEKVGQLDAKTADFNKSQLIKEIGKTFNSEEFFSHKIPNYIIYASAQTLINNQLENRLDCVEKLKLEERIVSFLTEGQEKKNTLSQALKLDPQYNNAVYKIVTRKFDEKYSETLNPEQKKILTKYAVSLISENKKILANAVRKEIHYIKDKLMFINNPEVAKDKDLLRKISECRQRMNDIDPDNLNETAIVQVLQFMSLANEVGD